MRPVRPVQDKRRWLGLAALSLTASVLVPVAIAMACNPQAYLTLDRASYAPGDSVRVSGSFFKNNAQVTVSVDRTGQSATVTTTGNGAFQATFALPSNAGTGGYSVTAIGYEANGDVVAGLPARGSFSVAAAQAAPAPSTPSGGGQPAASAEQPAAAAPSAGQPAAATATRPSARPTAGTSSPSFREPGVTSEPDVQTSATERRGSAGRTAPSTADRATANGRAVFGGSVAPSVSASTVAPVAAASTAAPASRSSQASRTGASSQSAAVSRQAAEQTAADDVWSAVGAGRSPSVLPVAGDGVAVSSPQAGSQLALGLVLLGTGVLALVGGLAAGEARRRRVRAR